MKLAVCLFGYTGNSDKKNIQNNLFDPEIASIIIKKKYFRDMMLMLLSILGTLSILKKLNKFITPKNDNRRSAYLRYSLDNYKLSYVSDYFGIIKNHENPEASLKDLISELIVDGCRHVNRLIYYQNIPFKIMSTMTLLFN